MFHAEKTNQLMMIDR